MPGGLPGAPRLRLRPVELEQMLEGPAQSSRRKSSPAQPGVPAVSCPALLLQLLLLNLLDT